MNPSSDTHVRTEIDILDGMQELDAVAQRTLKSFASADQAHVLVDGESVYCLNRSQLREAQRLVFAEAASSRRLGAELERLERTLDRNERAALAFVVIDRLLSDVSRR